MSRIGKKPIQIPDDVKVEPKENEILVKGPKGELRGIIPPSFNLEIRDTNLIISSNLESKKTKALWGLLRSLIFNMIQGVKEGFEKKLEIRGVGYKAFLDEKDLILHLGFSQPRRVSCIPGIDFSVEKNIITVSGIDKQKVGEVAAKIRMLRKPEPYKGKGIRYLEEVVKLKPGKKVVTTGT